ncbi:MAG: type I DNA topoisomerase [Candidatus Firestonebacteria bacterium]
MKKLIIVESPTKVHTISKFLGKGFIVRASMGHIIDLPKSKLGIDVENGFAPKYIVMRNKFKTLNQIKETVKEVDVIYFATDPDREGEAISWHIKNHLNDSGKKTYRVTFNEITKKAVLAAIEEPKDIDLKLVYAQQARRILDRLVGYLISPLLWKNVQGGLSAGRVQSVALRMICEREVEISNFKPEEYWSLEAYLKGESNSEFIAKLTKIKDEKIKIKTGEEAENIVKIIQDKSFIVKNIESKEKLRHPSPPFITSTLQQEASRKLGFTAKKTMFVAQQLYEGLKVGEEGDTGLITYMRTDSVRIAEEAIKEVRELIKVKYGDEYLPENPNYFKNKKGSQDAHESIRPTSALREPDKIKDYLSKDQFRLYDLIWKRFIASQMKPAISEITSIDIVADEYLFKASGTIIKFNGFLSVYQISEEEAKVDKEGILPILKLGEKLILLKLVPEQHFTLPPPRYNDATLVKALEENNIGRPSTYSPIISTILERNYVERIEKKFQPTELGVLVNSILVKTFPDIFSIKFTAEMEEELDKVEEGNMTWQKVIEDFYKPFNEDLKKAPDIMIDMKKTIDEASVVQVCEKCGKKMAIKWSRAGKFLACSGFPECKNTKSLGGDTAVKEETNEICEKCGSKMIIKFGRFGKFIACEKYPECKTTKSIGIGIKCPKEGCNGDIVFRKGKRGAFYGCGNYPKCAFITRYKPSAKVCPKCKYPVMVFAKDKFVCINPECKYEETGSDI